MGRVSALFPINCIVRDATTFTVLIFAITSTQVYNQFYDLHVLPLAVLHIAFHFSSLE